jgi:hypothetical protein
MDKGESTEFTNTSGRNEERWDAGRDRQEDLFPLFLFFLFFSFFLLFFIIIFFFFTRGLPLGGTRGSDTLRAIERTRPDQLTIFSYLTDQSNFQACRDERTDEFVGWCR